MRDPDRLVYFRQEAGGGLVMGGYERNPAPWAVAARAAGRLQPPPAAGDWARFEPLAEGAFALVPVLQTAEVVTMINGPEAFTPDGEFILGESDVRGFFVAAGFCAHGIAGAGGVGQGASRSGSSTASPRSTCGRWTSAGSAPQYRDRRLRARERRTRSTRRYYDIHYPDEERKAGRPLKMAPTYARLPALGAEFGEKSGWERANWFAIERGRALRGPPAARMGGGALVDRDRGRAPRDPRARQGCSTSRASRRSRCRGPGRVRVPAAALRERRRPAARERRLHADVEPPRRHRVPTSR